MAPSTPSDIDRGADRDRAEPAVSGPRYERGVELEVSDMISGSARSLAGLGAGIDSLARMDGSVGQLEQPSVSVIIPAWGKYSGALLQEAVNSALLASSRTPEVLVVDNASTPPVQVEDARLVRSDERLTLGASRNLGLSHATTDYVLFLDADDVLLPGAIDRMLREASGPKRNRTRPPLISASLINPVSGQPYHWPYPWMRRATTWPRLFQLLESFRPSFPVNGSLIVRSTALQTLGFDRNEASAEDWSFGVSLAWRCRVIPPGFPTMAYAPSVGGVWSRNDNLRRHLAHRRCVRLRIIKDASIPRWALLLVPLLLVGHSVDVLRKELRGVLRSLRSTDS